MMNNVKKGVCGSMQSAKSRKVLFELPRPRPKNSGRSAAVGRAGWLLRRAVKAEKSALRTLRLVEEAMAKVEELGKGFFIVRQRRHRRGAARGRGDWWGPNPHS